MLRSSPSYNSVKIKLPDRRLVNQIVIQGITFKDIDGSTLTLSQTRRPYGRLLAAHCKAAYDNARRNMNIFGLLPNHISDRHRHIQGLIDITLNDDIDTKAKVLKWLLNSPLATPESIQSSTCVDSITSQVLSMHKLYTNYMRNKQQ